MSPSHHISRTRRYLKYATGDTARGDYDRAARALARANSHAATAVCVHWHYLGALRPTRRRHQSWLCDLARKGYVTYGLTAVLRDSYALPDRISDTLTKAGAANPAGPVSYCLHPGPNPLGFLPLPRPHPRQLRPRPRLTPPTQ